ncbi:MAG: PEP/pyruvate-binding domain-containing protein [Clostridiales Family XIII bacterium]|nr:PEP/pyruvate-binding domain-containing protein [Clostridiales Family XIII bacterium]
MINQKKALSGLTGLDRALEYLRYGDNIVWQVADFREYAFFAEPFARASLRELRNTIYFRFGQGADILPSMAGLRVIDVDPRDGFESVVMGIHDVIEKEGYDTHYIFDPLSMLQEEWVADFMMGNFFVVLTSDITKYNCVAYYAVYRNTHSVEAMARIRESSQVILDVFRHNEELYLHPLRATERYTYSMFLPHMVDIGDPNVIEPLTNGIDMSRFYSIIGASGNVESEQRLDSWERFFLEKQRDYSAADTLNGGLRALCRLVFGNDERILNIAEKNVGLNDILEIKARMIGVGSIGGKATGMILSRMIVEKRLPKIAELLEAHDSFYICSNLYYTFLIKNNCWSLKLKQRTKRGYFAVAEVLKEKIMESVFTENIREQFRRMLEYYGRSPIIVRSSSLLEDGFGNAFAGKYESVFCVNVGTLEERLEAFERAVKTVYASTMDESVLEYRLQRGLADKDEQMALLVQRVSGSLFQDFYMPMAAGVAYSYNSYRWSKDIDPTTGMVRMVMGLGTRAVDRTGGDYPRIAALDKPELRANSGADVSRFAQHKVDVLEFATNSLATLDLEYVQTKMKDWSRAMMIEHDFNRERELKELGIHRKIVYTTCDNILRREDFVDCLRKMLAAIQEEYDYPVDMEFAVNFSQDGSFLINLLQCRPLQVGGSGIRKRIPEISRDKTFFHLNGGTMGGAYSQEISHVIQVEPAAYYEYPYHKKHGVARLIGEINQHFKNEAGAVMLLAPGRIGTSSPELGVPVKFAEISNINVACEVAYEGAGYMPELSFGSHFFQDLVEADIFYASIFENKNTTVYYDPHFFDGQESLLDKLGGEIDYEGLEDIVKIYDVRNRGLKIVTDITTGETLCGEF